MTDIKVSENQTFTTKFDFGFINFMFPGSNSSPRIQIHGEYTVKGSLYYFNMTLFVNYKEPYYTINNNVNVLTSTGRNTFKGTAYEEIRRNIGKEFITDQLNQILPKSTILEWKHRAAIQNADEAMRRAVIANDYAEKQQKTSIEVYNEWRTQLEKEKKGE